ncbi:hypothetical protein LGH82_17565 [Mesorhizobium sp. PAMC28654]|uniref:hypothetical protein n=1 Tax=Mesorhizobium sp. PAMC28654 TaxID=2880934 RepID=UPI001D0A417F|nr:hypothetical protein [Mesorhizobium sp. PAMC28654]UDL87027.1 hypothetical protein LGH82_17565 [Mesorhizobium sp. PAMC28654]
MKARPNILGHAMAEALSTRQEIEALARVLAQKMQAVHGLDYRIQIDHDPAVAFVVIAPKSKAAQS